MFLRRRVIINYSLGSEVRVHAEYRRGERGVGADGADDALVPQPLLQALLQVRLLPSP
jgi:hypothetical protein